MLGIDLGNSTITFGIFEIGNLRTRFQLPSNLNQTSEELLQSVEYGFKTIFGDDWREEFQPEEIVMSSVVPDLSSMLIKSLENFFDIEIVQIDHQTPADFSIKIENPETIGSDRLANAYACKVHHALPAINIDIGTALTIDYIDEDAQLVGGVIVPGPVSALQGLAQRGAQLPSVDLVRAPKVIGNSTASAIQSGVFYGWLDLCQGICNRFQEESGPVRSIILTGGLSELFFEYFTTEVIHEPDLTLKGLYCYSLGS